MKSVKLSEIADFQEGYVNPKQTNNSYFDGPIKWLRAVDLNNSNVYSTSRTLTRKGFESAGSSACLFPPNSLAISKSGTIGRVGILKDWMCGNRAIINIKPNEKIVNTKYLFYCLLHGRPQIERLAEGSVQKNLYISELSKFEVPLPKINIQEKIAQILGTLDEKIELNKKTSETLEEISEAVFKSWFVNFEPVRAKAKDHSTGLPNEISDLFPVSFEDSELGRIPKGWSYSPFHKFMTQKKERVGQRKATVLSAVNSGELVSSEEYFTKKVYSKNIAKYIAIEKYDIAYNPSRINIGSIGLHYEDYLGAVSPIYIVITPYIDWHWFSIMSIKRDYFNQNVKVLSSGSVRQTLSIKDFLSISVVTPPISSPLISYFNNFYDLLLKRQILLREENLYLQDITYAILPRLISGQLRVSDAEKILDEAGI